MEITGLLIAAVLIALFVVITVARAVRIVPQARARNVERLGRYHRTLQPGLNFVIPYIDRVYPKIDLREQVVSFKPQPVITEDNLVVEIDTVLYFQVTDPRSAAYEIASYLQAVEQLTVTTLRNVVGSMDLEQTLTSRDSINSQLRGVLDEATGKWGLRVNRVEIKAIDPPKTIKDAMEKQMRAERDKRAAILYRGGPAPVADPHRRGRQAGRHPARRGRPHRGHPQGRGRGPRDRRGLHRRTPQRPRPEAAGLPVPAGPPPARPGRGQHLLRDPQRAHRRPAGRLPRVHRSPPPVRGHGSGRGHPGHFRTSRAGCGPRCRSGRGSRGGGPTTARPRQARRRGRRTPAPRTNNER